MSNAQRKSRRRLKVVRTASARSREEHAGDSRYQALSRPSVPELYVEADIGDGWTARYRFRDQDGVPVVVELHVFHGAPRTGELTDAAWDGIPGPKAIIPPGGLMAIKLREVPLGPAIVGKVLAERQTFARATAALVGGFSHRAPKTSARQTRGDAYYADLAAQYVDAYGKDPQRPNVVLARKLGLHRDQVRDALHDARRRGMLTTAAPGRPGGELTPKAIDILEAKSKTTKAKKKGRR